MIPNNLKEEEFKFVLIGSKSKKPFEKDWANTNNYSFNDEKVTKHLNNNGNLGIIGGYGNLIIVDFDDKEIAEKLIPIMPKTFIVETGSGGFHLYYKSNHCKAFKVMHPNKDTIADVQGKGKQAIIPPSTHPNGNKYKVYSNESIANIEYSELQAIFSEWTGIKKQEKAITTQTQNKLIDEIKNKIPLIDVMKLFNFDTSKYPNNTKCIWHDSKGGNCFSVNQLEKYFYCFHCGAGGSVINLVMQEKKINFKNAIEWLQKEFDVEFDNFKSYVSKKFSNLDELRLQVYKSLADENKIRGLNNATEHCVIYIKQNFHIKTIRSDNYSEMWVYTEGLYYPNAKTKINEVIRDVLTISYHKKFVKLVVDKIESDTYIDQEDFFDLHKEYLNLIPVENGLLDINTKKILPFTPELYFFNKLNFPYDPKTECNDFEDFLIEVTKYINDPMIIQEWFGYCLLRDYKYQVALMFEGIGRNGKGIIFNVLRKFLGKENICALELKDLQKDSENFLTYQLHNKMANIGGDISNTPIIETNKFKGLTGKDILTANIKNKDPITFENYAKMMFAANELPLVHDNKDAFWLRWMIIEFPNQYLRENELIKNPTARLQIQNIEERFIKKGNLSGILNWALEGLERLERNKGFSFNKTANEVKELWVKKSNSIKAFFDKYFEYVDNPEEFISKDFFNKKYSEFCKKSNLTNLGPRLIFKFLTKEGINSERIRLEDLTQNKASIWQNIKLNKDGLVNLVNLVS